MLGGGVQNEEEEETDKFVPQELVVEAGARVFVWVGREANRFEIDAVVFWMCQQLQALRYSVACGAGETVFRIFMLVVCWNLFVWQLCVNRCCSRPRGVLRKGQGLRHRRSRRDRQGGERKRDRERNPRRDREPEKHLVGSPITLLLPQG